MRILLLSALLFLTSTVSFSQISPKIDDTEKDYFTNPDTANWAKRYHQNPEDKSLTPVLSSNAVVRYKNGAVCYVEVADDKFNASFLLTEKSGKYQSVRSLKKGQVRFSNLPLDKNFMLVGKNSFGKETVLLEINTKEPPKGAVSISDSLYSRIGRWVLSEKPKPLKDFLAEQIDIDYIEKLAFYQQHQLQGKLIDENLPWGEFPESDNTNNALLSTTESSNCICTFTLRASKSFAPGRTFSNDANVVLDNIYADYTPVWLPSGKGGIRAFSHSGPAKWQQVQQSAACSSANFAWLTNDTATSKGIPYFASIGYTLVCNQATTQTPSNCGCEKDIFLNANYITQLNVDAATQRALAFCWGSRGSRATAEDAAILIEHRFREQSATLLAAGRASANIHCSSAFNPDFLITPANIAEMVTAKLAQSSSPLDIKDTIFLNKLSKASFIRDLTAKIITLTGTPRVLQEKVCGGKQNNAQLVNTNAARALSPNNPTEIMLFSFSALNVGGFTRWTNSARVLSSFRLGAVLWSGPREITQQHCCSAPVAAWIHKDMIGSTNNRSNLQSFISSRWPSNGGPVPVINHDFGHVGGVTNNGCIPLANRRSASNDPANAIRLVDLQDGLYIQGNVNDDAFEVFITDIVGRTVHYQKGASDNQLVWNAHKGEALSSGIYIAKARLANGAETILKIIKQ